VRAWSEELRRVHQRLRAARDIAREAIESGAAPSGAASLTRDLLLQCWGFCTALDGHHRGEDDSLFPRIASARPDLAPTLDLLRQDHSMMSHLIRGLEQALTSGADRATLLGHLDGLDAIMESHFAYEERELLTVLDAVRLDVDRTSALGPLAD